MSPPRVFLHYADAAALRADHAANLARGRAFVPGATELRLREACELVLVHPDTGAALCLGAELVHVQREGDGAGVGVAWTSTPEDVERLRAFVEDAVAELEVVEDDEPGGELEVVEEVEEGARAGDPSAHMHERIRRLTQPEQQRLARGGSLTERTMLERVFGPSVWEALLQNSRLTPPEVARIAKKGTLPKPLVEQIAANAAWLGVPEVQRALLSNPRSSSSVVARVLRALSKGDLSRVPQQTAYPMAVRLAAKKLLKG